MRQIVIIMGLSLLLYKVGVAVMADSLSVSGVTPTLYVVSVTNEGTTLFKNLCKGYKPEGGERMSYKDADYYASLPRELVVDMDSMMIVFPFVGMLYDEQVAVFFEKSGTKGKLLFDIREKK